MRTGRAVVALLVLAATMGAGAKRIATAPALGPFIDPAHGFWSLARTNTLPASSTEQLHGLGAGVTVIYDDRAVPHIFALTEADAYRALGYVVARDRLFQMHVQTLAASGRLTELAGAGALPLDREMRQLGIPRAAERTLRTQDTAIFMQNVFAYADGVNAYIRTMPASELPIEFRLTATQPPEWKPLHSFLLLERMGYQLASIAQEYDHAAAAARVGSLAADALFPSESPVQEPIQPSTRALPKLSLRKLPQPAAGDTTSSLLVAAARNFIPSVLALADSGNEPRSFASNNWAVSPKRTANGFALLEGDPHLDMTLPSLWYEVHLVVPGKLDVYGVTIPGAPTLVIGFNRDVSWTFTNTGADVMDLYAEKVDNARHPARYEVDGQWRKLESRVEIYRDQKGRAVATDTLYYTHRGPMRRVRGRWLSMRWTVLESGREPQAFYDASHAKSSAEFQDAFARSYVAPAQNMLSADRGGHIAIRSTGLFPIRPANGAGNVVFDGTKSSNDWTGYLPVARYPQAVDPAQGFLASANQQPIHPLETHDWWGGSYDPWRALRINALLRADSAMTHEKMQQFQTDPGSERANAFVPYFLAAAKRIALHPATGVNPELLAESARLLAQWDRRYTKDNTRAVLFEEAMRELNNRTWDELTEAGSATRRAATPGSAVLLELLADSASLWWDDRVTSQVEQRDDILAMSLVAALQNTKRQHGAPDSGGWRWDRIRFDNIDHLLRLAPFSADSIPQQGGIGTLNPSIGTGHHGPSWRLVVEMGPQIRAWATYPGGQSGNPFSPRYRDRIPMWAAGQLEAVHTPATAQDLSSAARTSTLTLVP